MAETDVLAESTWDEEKQEWTHSCGTIVLGAKVYHPIHDGPFPLSGSGDVQVVTVPYCPKCQEKPRENGAPISVGPKVF